MQAAIFDALNQPLRLVELDDPEPDRYQVLLKICRCGICGSDLHITQDPVFGARAGDVLGHEFSGKVLEVGAGVTHLKVGDQVTAAPLSGCGACDSCHRGEPAWCAQMRLIGGGYAQYTALAARQCRKLPWGISAADGALAEPLAVALHGVRQARMEPGDRVLVVGAGAIGLAVAYWARRLGAGSVVVTDLHRHQEQRALALGATAFLIADDDLARQARDRLGGEPDVVFECVGKPGLIDRCIGLVRPRGTVLVLGLCTAQDHFDAFRAISKEVRITMSVFFSMREFEIAIDALDQGHRAPQALISETIALADLPVAFEALRRRTSQCKVLVDPFRPGAPCGT
ncbi:alcohol dehydrogenase catalytic domain-containing protein [Sphaerotilus montanus]|uniref:(R,R)-butanediol dehydrogenase/meso-butanediol dehydrogenase/diacetyl reductase n=1 Tax=Sphaerotilus montanus TaxID=522889 RepID=A0A7Y9R3R2_9BURK|nr:alcohol dehydrogenase catalytic domain-containing protein [Sphaerotilus montanus]NYG35003.1 (R,R)-butanediol dehydrogenase/meso-butanediol dehydrogenase/diacetyl reductase [Sphaerotilus montanus]NZD57821.1 alcohol dehydrogenase catalytic domain-containing protein [Sphaerotilus montanus]